MAWLHFDTTPQFWLGLQADYDLDVASDNLGERLDREVRVQEQRSKKSWSVFT